MWQQGTPQKDIAKAVGKYPSTISRELRNNRTFVRTAFGSIQYKAHYAQYDANQRKKEKPKAIKFTSLVETFVHEKLQLKWSPEQISGMLRLTLFLALAMNGFINLS